MSTGTAPGKTLLLGYEPNHITCIHIHPFQLEIESDLLNAAIVERALFD